jgi:hypothetical protein
MSYANAALAALVDTHTTLLPGTGYVTSLPVDCKPQHGLDVIFCKHLVVTPAGHEFLRYGSR